MIGQYRCFRISKMFVIEIYNYIVMKFWESNYLCPKKPESFLILPILLNRITYIWSST